VTYLLGEHYLRGKTKGTKLDPTLHAAITDVLNELVMLREDVEQYTAERDNALDGQELAWAAGFFDGEGCTFLSHGGAGGRKRYPRLSVGQNHREPLDRLAAAIGAGNVVGPYKGEFKWTLGGQKAASAMERLRPYLCAAKREQYDAAVASSNERNDSVG
jgi:hypothetical protein